MARGKQRRRCAADLGFEHLESRLAMAVVINEFMALNTSGIQDQDGDRSDWIELRNTEATPVNLAGWHLTDDAGNLAKWTFPAVTIPGNGYLLVYASDKDRTVAGQQLHTNFALNDQGEHLALVMPDGVTVADAYDPFPPQLANVSYGRGGQVPISENLVGEAAPFRYLVPSSTTSTTWYSTAFDDSTWTYGAGGVGFDNVPDYLPYFNVDVGPQMLNVRASIYLRYAFSVVNPADVTSLVLRMRYDDGFGIYLNGTLIPPAARQNSPATLSWNSNATAGHADNLAIIYDDFDLSPYKHLLAAGDNVLAIHGLNTSASNGDFLIAPMLVGTRPSAPVTGYMTSPTPNAANQQGTLGVVADTKFSVNRGFFTAPFNVAITTATAGAEIRYTTDGSLPTATNGLIYNPASPPLITTTTTLRAAAFKVGYSPTNVDTQTYIFLGDVILQNGNNLPPYAPWGLSLSNPVPDWEMDPAVVNNPAYASTIKDDLKAVPTVSLVMPWNDWFGGGGQGIYPTTGEIERAVSMEYFNADGTQQFQIDAGIEIQGGTSDDRWKMDKLSMRVKFKAPYGPEKLDFNIFTAGERNAGAAASFNTLILDAHLGYTWAYGGPAGSTQRVNAMYVQDAYVSDLQNLAGGAAPHSRWVHLYINGLYWGLYDMHERADEHFAESYLGGNDEDWDVIKHRPGTEVSGVDVNPDPLVYTSSAITNYAALLNLVRQDMSNPANYAAVAAKLDIDDFISYMVVNYYVGNDDWAHQNWYASFNRVDPNGKWRYHSWDAENVLKDLNRDSTTLNNIGGPTEVFQLLIQNPEFRLRFADLVQRHLRNNGLMTPAQASAAWQARAAEIERALVGESARWGDSRTVPHNGPAINDPVGVGNPYLLSHWVTRNNFLLNNYFPFRTGVVLNQFNSRGWNVPLTAPVFSNYGGTVAQGTNITLSKPGGSPAAAVLYYTLDGSDPRDPATNLPRAGTLTYAGTPITINSGTKVNARIFNDVAGSSVNEWSPVVEATFLLETPFPLRITELHYNPAAFGSGDPQNLEFIELMNTSAQSISLNGVQITQFSSTPYAFPNGLTLAPGERIVVAKNPAAFVAAYGPGVRIAPDGYGTQNLSNAGERIALLGPLGETLQDFVYDDENGWPTAADGNGKSLEIINPLGDPSVPANWRASYYIGGSPGTAGLPPLYAGDFDDDNDVDGNDFLLWQRGVGTPALRADAALGDADGDRDVDRADFNLWRGSYGSGASAEPAGHAAAETALAAAVMLQSDEWILADAVFADPKRGASVLFTMKPQLGDAAGTDSTSMIGPAARPLSRPPLRGGLNAIADAAAIDQAIDDEFNDGIDGEWPSLL